MHAGAGVATVRAVLVIAQVAQDAQARAAPAHAPAGDLDTADGLGRTLSRALDDHLPRNLRVRIALREVQCPIV